MASGLKSQCSELAILGGLPAFCEPLHVGRPNIGALPWLFSPAHHALALVNTVSFLPLLFLGQTQYNPNSSVGRKFLLLACERWAGGGGRDRRIAYGLVIGGMLALGILWVFLYSKFFVYYKLF